jgi:hypothetical protein
MHDIFLDPCLPLTLAPLPQCFDLRDRLYLGMMLGCFALVRVAIYLRLALGNAHSWVRGKTLPNISCLLLAAPYGCGTEGGWNFKAKVC